jgi:hypothetical protein
MSLRQFWVRIAALPDDSPLHEARRSAMEKAEIDKQARDVDDALDMMRPKER